MAEPETPARAAERRLLFEIDMPDGGAVTGEIVDSRLELFRWGRAGEEGTRSGYRLNRDVPGCGLDYALAERLASVVAERDEALARLALPSSAVELIAQRWEDRAEDAEQRVERWAGRAEQAEAERDDHKGLAGKLALYLREGQTFFTETPPGPRCLSCGALFNFDDACQPHSEGCELKALLTEAEEAGV